MLSKIRGMLRSEVKNISTEVSKIPSVGGLIIIFNNHFAVKGWAFDLVKIKSYLLNDADTAHIGFAFSDVLGYTVHNVIE